MCATYMHEANTDYYKARLTMELEPLSCFCYWEGLVKYTCAIVGIKVCEMWQIWLSCQSFICTKVIENAKSSNETTVGQIMLLIVGISVHPFKIKLHHITKFPKCSNRLKGSAKMYLWVTLNIKWCNCCVFYLRLCCLIDTGDAFGRVVNVTGSCSSSVAS